MPKIIHQSVKFADTSPDELFAAYLDSERHGAMVGAEARITDRVGDRFWVFGEDKVRGRNLFIGPNHTIVQTWRGQPWLEDDQDSIVVLVFSDGGGNGTEVQLMQAGVPDNAFEIIDAGWHRLYWGPWRTYLERLGTEQT